jgi:hypothetical protein
MLQSNIVDIDGVFVGAAIRIDRDYRFVATDVRLEELDSSIWPTLADIQRVARRVYQNAASAGPISPSIHAPADLANTADAEISPDDVSR